MLNPETTIEATIDESQLRQRVAANMATVTAWATARVVVDATGAIEISQLYADYESYCRRGKYPPLSRKVWIAAMKLAGFETQSGGFAGLKLRLGSADLARASTVCR